MLLLPTDSLYAHRNPYSVRLSIQITDNAVSYHVIFKARYLSELLPTFKPDSDLISLETLEKIKPELEKLFTDLTPVYINRKKVIPRLTSFFPISEQEAETGKINLNIDDVFLTLTFPTESKPETAQLSWNFFPEDILTGEMIKKIKEYKPGEVSARLTAFDDTRQVVFSPTCGKYDWYKPGTYKFTPPPVLREKKRINTKYLIGAVAITSVITLFTGICFFRSRKKTTGVISISTLLVTSFLVTLFLTSPMALKLSEDGVVKPSGEKATAIFRKLHENIYRAFDNKEESDIYNTLAQSVDGKLLDQVYTEVYKHHIANADKGTCFIQSTDIIDAIMKKENTSLPEFKIDCEWKVRGVVSHWGHAHSRTNKYRATYTVDVMDNSWKITDIEITKHTRETE